MRQRRSAAAVPGSLAVALAVSLLAAGAGHGVPAAPTGSEQEAGVEAEAELEEEEPVTTDAQRRQMVRDALAEAPLIDGHNDLPWNIRKFVHNQLRDLNLAEDLRDVEPWSRSPWSHTDLMRMREGLVGGQFWAAYVPCESQQLNAVQLTLEQIDLIRRFIDKYPGQLAFAASADEIVSAHAGRRIASLIGVEGGHSIGSSLAVLRVLYALGVRYMTLTHACHTPWADSSSDHNDDKFPHHGGLTSFGKVVVREMNRLGMMVDLSHASVRTMKDALETSKAPVIFSHSSAYSICNSSRNVPDDVLRQLADNGGIVMVNFYTYFITCNATANISDVIAHINHVREVAGVDHVGIGAGYDGINHTPTGLEDVSRYPYLLAELMNDPLWTEEDVKKLAGLNLLRVFREVEEVRDKWQLAAVTPAEDLIPAADLEGHTTCMYLDS